jgi:hypothetical protein
VLQADKLDPKEQAKMESREWINDMVDRLNVRIEQFEYEMEELQAGLKKKAKPPPKLVQVSRNGMYLPDALACSIARKAASWLFSGGSRSRPSCH